MTCAEPEAPVKAADAGLAAGVGGPCRDRTYDQEIKSLLLYQLS
jgi:hypothetical protein